MTSTKIISYVNALDFMNERVKNIHLNEASNCIWLLEHPSLITLGTSGIHEDILDTGLPIHKTGRGGKATYHGPGQRIVYIMLNLKPLGCDLKKFVRLLEAWILLTLKTVGVNGFTDPNRVGVWVKTERGDEKIAAIGIRVRKWVSFHGFAINVNPDLSHFKKIVPCGLTAAHTCSLQSLGINETLETVDMALKNSFYEVFHMYT